MELSRLSRSAGLALAFAALWAASPGIVSESGLWPLALLGVALWARVASAPGPWAFALELVCAGAGWCGLMSWAALVHGSTLAFIGPGHGLYFAVQGWALRRFARRMPLSCATPAAWMLFETLRTVLEPPFGVSWMRLGSYTHDALWLSGSARVWGTGGLSFALAALAGALADISLARSAERKPARPLGPSLAFGLAPFVAAIALAHLVPAPQVVDGPRVLLVQPSFDQARKQANDNQEMMFDQVELTQRGLTEARQAGEPTPDLVAWAETMFRLPIFERGTAQAIREGAERDPWRGAKVDAAWVEGWEAAEVDWIDGWFFGKNRAREALLPEGTAFVAGAEYLRALDGRVRFQNSVLLWPGSVALRRGPASKLHLVPGAETMLGLEHIESVRSVIHGIAKYVPDFLGRQAGEDLLSFTARDGRSFRFGVAVCFDNAFDDVFVGPARTADVDFHMVFSNEAWFLRSHQVEQMLAFSRLAALSTGRSVVRCTQSGASMVIGPDGRDVARLRDAAGEDEMVAGTLRATVPVPVGGVWTPFETDESRPPRATTFFVRTSLAWTALWTALPALLLVLGVRGARAARA
ncbi:MAG: apolipoprotein N-acyltransferase [Planctomycetes bacterium]|nr:apolipoprotein N-acyltransferase [Planctomycetota bacterium]